MQHDTDHDQRLQPVNILMHDSTASIVQLAAGVSDDAESSSKLGEAVYMLMHDSNYCLIKYLAADVSDDGESLGKLGEPVYNFIHDSTVSIVSFGCRCV